MCGVAASAEAQGGGFMFGRPKGTFAVRIGGISAPPNSDVFADITDFLTLNRSDFAGVTGGADFGVRVANRLDIQLSGGFASRSKRSVYRGFTDTDDIEIEQKTQFTRVPLTAGVKLYLTSPGRSISQLSWVPARIVPYIGGGGGAMYYRLKQTGSFVDFVDLSVFDDEIKATGWAPAAYGHAGVEYSIASSVGLIADARYDFAKGDLDNRQWQDYRDINLSGITGSIGLTFRF